ncbi:MULTISPECIES: hypothetical protein [Cysteiniphilum]|nr:MULTISPECIES: hypothetical protein [Cysteiniphilum]
MKKICVLLVSVFMLGSTVGAFAHNTDYTANANHAYKQSIVQTQQD